MQGTVKDSSIQRKFHWYDYITINSYHFGLSTLSQTLAPLVVPLLVQQFVGDQLKATYFGNLRLWGLMVAMLAQAFWGLISDHSPSKWGRRRPFIFAGTLMNLVFAVLIGLCGTSGLVGMNGYWLLLGVYVLLQISFNAGQGAAQGFLPDLVPQNLLGRFSAVKTLLEVPLPVILVSFAIAPMIVKDNFWGGILVACVTMTFTMLLTMLVREEPLRARPAPLDWRPFMRLLLMTAFFAAVILGLGALIRALGDLLASQDSIPAIFLTMGALGLAAMLVTIVLGVWISIRIGIGSAVDRSFTCWVICRLAFMVGVFNLSTFAVYFLQARLGLVKEQAAGPASRLMLFVGVAIFIFAALSGWLADRFSRRRLVATAAILAAFGTLVAVLSTNQNLIFLGGGLIGAGTGLFYTSSWALGTRLVPKQEAGRYLGISNLAGAGAGAVGAYLGGPIADAITAHVPGIPGLGYILLFSIYGVLFLFSMIPLIWVKE